MSEVLRETTQTTAFIFAVLLGATAFALVLRGLGGDALIERALLSLPFGPNGILVCILLATFVLGFFLDWIELTLIILPLVAPVVVGLGFDPVWFTVLFAVCLQTSFLTPPGRIRDLLPQRGGAARCRHRDDLSGRDSVHRPAAHRAVILFYWRELVTWLPAQAYG
jgi:TRAP-type mannitol/chloroaromatic compound transport system permease large subunit